MSKHLPLVSKIPSAKFSRVYPLCIVADLRALVRPESQSAFGFCKSERRLRFLKAIQFFRGMLLVLYFFKELDYLQFI